MYWELQHDEQILWEGQPKQGLVLRQNDLYWTPIGLLFSAFAIFWLNGVLSAVGGSAGGAAFAGFGFLFLGWFLYLGVVRHLHDAWIRAHTHYAVTNQRVIVERETSGDPHTVSVKLANLPRISTSHHRDGTGSIVLLPGEPHPGNHFEVEFKDIHAGVHLPTLARYMPVQFERIEHADRVATLISEQRAIARAERGDSVTSRRRDSGRVLRGPLRRRTQLVTEQLDATTDWDLREDERLLWTGRPREGLTLRHSDWYWIPVSIFAMALATGFWVGPIVLGDAPWPFIIVAVVLASYALLLFVGRFFIDASQRSRTVYALTNQRAIIGRAKAGAFERHDIPLTVIDMRDVSWRARKDGSGTLWFDRNRPYAIGKAEGVPGPGYQAPKFDLVDDVEAVYHRFCDARAAVRRR